MGFFRKRLTAAQHALGLNHDNTATVLRTDTLLKYQDKLAPLLSQQYVQALQQQSDAEVAQRSLFALKHSLSVPIVEVTNLTVQPGEPHFVLWLFISSYFPLISACIAPVANLISLIGLVEHWRVHTRTQRTVSDPSLAFVLNILLFVLGVLGNASLLMNFSGKMRYLVTQSVSITCWVVAATFLLAAIIVTNKLVVAPDALYRRSEGFWLATFTIAMYCGCSFVQIVNFMGYKLDKYPPTFNLDFKQRLLMSYTIAFSVWQASGTIAMAHLIPGLSYGASLYYCTVSMLTIGLGDIVPLSSGAKVYALIFSFVGVMIMGLIVAMIRQVVLSSASPSVFWHHIERKRIAELDKIERQHTPITVEESFNRMRTLRKQVRVRQMNMSLALSSLIFILFWLVGALVFKFSESWDYFNAMYFCFLCLVTIGYGDFHPTSAFGRSFFVMWAIAAVPLMTILISSVGDKLFEFAGRLDKLATFLLNWKTYFMFIRPRSAVDPLPATRDDIEGGEDDIEGGEDEQELDEAVEEVEKTFVNNRTGSGTSADTVNGPAEPMDTIRRTLNRHFESSNQIRDRVTALRLLLFDIVEEPEKRYDLDEWSELLRILENDPQLDDPTYWLGDNSPLRLPIKEPNYLLMKMFVRVERDLQRLVEAQQHDLDKLNELSKIEGVSPVMLQSSLDPGPFHGS